MNKRIGFCCKWLNDPSECGGMKVNAVDRDLNGRSTTMRWLREHNNFKYVPVLSEPLATDDWRGRTGLVHEAVMQDMPDMGGCQVYACGVPVMVESARREFTALRMEDLPAEASAPTPVKAKPAAKAAPRARKPKVTKA
jgi:ferredoxin-NADP reductase